MREGKYQSKKLNLEFHSSYLIMAIGFLLSGYYLNLIVFTLLILFHEFGHYMIARLFGIKVLKIIVYPYGGRCVLEDFINRDLYIELLVAMAGVIFQFLFYSIIFLFFKIGYIRGYVMNLFTLYNNQMIFFNLLPIYPLDGGRIVQLFLCFCFPYYFANLICVVFSFIVIIVFFLLDIYQCNFSNIMVLGVLVWYLFKFYFDRKYWYHKFLLERYLYKVDYKRVSVVNSIKNMYKNRVHFIFFNNKYEHENEVLKSYLGK